MKHPVEEAQIIIRGTFNSRNGFVPWPSMAAKSGAGQKKKTRHLFISILSTVTDIDIKTTYIFLESLCINGYSHSYSDYLHRITVLDTVPNQSSM